MKKPLWILFFVLGFTTFLVLPFLQTETVLAQTETESRIAFPEIFPEENQGLEDFRVYIRNFYVFAIGAALLIATVLIMIGGFIWVTSAGNQERVSMAQSYITQSVIGVVLLMSAYLILRLINPALVELKLPDLPDLENLGACVLPDGTCEDGHLDTTCVLPNYFHHGTTCFEFGREALGALSSLSIKISQCNSYSNSEVESESECQSKCSSIVPGCELKSYSENTCTCQPSEALQTQFESIALSAEQHRCSNGGKGFDISIEDQCDEYCFENECLLDRDNRDLADFLPTDLDSNCLCKADPLKAINKICKGPTKLTQPFGLVGLGVSSKQDICVDHCENVTACTYWKWVDINPSNGISLTGGDFYCYCKAKR